MKPETETLLRNIISLDPEITKENAERAIDTLRGKLQSDEDLVHVLRFKEVRKLLNVHRRTLEYYINQGYLDRVYGRGQRAIGITRDSFLRFTTQRVIVRNNPRSGEQERRFARSKNNVNGCHAGGRHVSQAKGKEIK